MLNMRKSRQIGNRIVIYCIINKEIICNVFLKPIYHISFSKPEENKKSLRQIEILCGL